MRKRILICGGGTAGHIYPAVSIIENIKNYYPDCKLLFVGTKSGMENKCITELGVDFDVVKACGLNIDYNLYKKILNYLRFLFLLTLGFIKSFKIIKRFKPDSQNFF